MKNIQNIAIAVLSVAVLTLYILQFSKSTPIENTVNEENKQPEKDSLLSAQFAKDILAANDSLLSGKILWVNIEELTVKYEYYDEVQKEINTLSRKHERLLMSKQQTYRQKSEDLMTLYQKGMLTQETGEIRQREIMQLEQEIMQLEQQANKELGEKTMALDAKIYKNVSSFLSQYSKEINCDYILGYTPGNSQVLYVNDSLDITQAVINGLNKAYRAGK